MATSGLPTFLRWVGFVDVFSGLALALAWVCFFGALLSDALMRVTVVSDGFFLLFADVATIVFSPN